MKLLYVLMAVLFAILGDSSTTLVLVLDMGASSVHLLLYYQAVIWQQLCCKFASPRAVFDWVSFLCDGMTIIALCSTSFWHSDDYGFVFVYMM